MYVCARDIIYFFFTLSWRRVYLNLPIFHIMVILGFVIHAAVSSVLSWIPLILFALQIYWHRARTNIPPIQRYVQYHILFIHAFAFSIFLFDCLNLCYRWFWHLGLVLSIFLAINSLDPGNGLRLLPRRLLSFNGYFAGAILNHVFALWVYYTSVRVFSL
jgi:hypothetical protein